MAKYRNLLIWQILAIFTVLFASPAALWAQLPVVADDAAHPDDQTATKLSGQRIMQIFDFEELAKDCAADGVYEFMFVAPPLRIVGGVGSPLSPLAIK